MVQLENHQRMPILVGESLMRNRIFHNLKVPPYTLFTNYKETTEFIVAQSGRYHFNKVIKINITNIGINHQYAFPDNDTLRMQHHFCCTAVHKLLPSQEVSGNPNWPILLKKKCQGQETHMHIYTLKLRNLSQIKGD